MGETAVVSRGGGNQTLLCGGLLCRLKKERKVAFLCRPFGQKASAVSHIPTPTGSAPPFTMDPQSFNHRTEQLATGRTYHFVIMHTLGSTVVNPNHQVDQVPEGYDPQRTPTLLCIHGFPDLWYKGS